MAHAPTLLWGAANTVSARNVDMNFQYDDKLVTSCYDHASICRWNFPSYVVFLSSKI